MRRWLIISLIAFGCGDDSVEEVRPEAILGCVFNANNPQSTYDVLFQELNQIQELEICTGLDQLVRFYTEPELFELPADMVFCEVASCDECLDELQRVTTECRDVIINIDLTPDQISPGSVFGCIIDPDDPQPSFEVSAVGSMEVFETFSACSTLRGYELLRDRSVWDLPRGLVFCETANCTECYDQAGEINAALDCL